MSRRDKNLLFGLILASTDTALGTGMLHFGRSSVSFVKEIILRIHAMLLQHQCILCFFHRRRPFFTVYLIYAACFLTVASLLRTGMFACAPALGKPEMLTPLRKMSVCYPDVSKMVIRHHHRLPGSLRWIHRSGTFLCLKRCQLRQV